MIGQQHVLAQGKPLWRALQNGRLYSMILWGPPGVGKTTIGRLLAEASGREFCALSAVLDGLTQFRTKLLHIEQRRQPTVLFIDEIHRLDKTRQKAVLSGIDNGFLTLIGATTENPSFQLDRALLGKVSVHVLYSLSQPELNHVLERAQANQQTLLPLDDSAKRRLFVYADGDARRLLNLIEQLQHSHVSFSTPRIDAQHIDELAGWSPPASTTAMNTCMTWFLHFTNLYGDRVQALRCTGCVVCCKAAYSAAICVAV
ncbi:AAA family ATPase [Pseudomonas putida]|nr:AAA family ATPase [Pseudomonas putida]